MLEYIFGNATAEKVLLHVFHYGEIHASAIAQDYGISITPVLNQLNRFELAGVLVSKQVGRSRIYSFNHKSPIMLPLKDLIKIVYTSVPLEKREQIFKLRRRPRRKGKPIK
jgi:predicted transcriptional regulator